MKPNQDAFGAEIYEHFRGRKAYEVIERDDGYVDLSSGPKPYFAEYKSWGKHEQQAIRYARGRVLDIGAGAGRVALYLQKKGYDVLATDNSPLAVKVCKLRGVKKAKVIPVAALSPKLGVFDTIVMYGNNFGLFGSYQRAKILLRRFHKMTSPDARIITESLNVYQTTDKDHLAYHRFNRSRGRMAGQLRLRVLYKKLRTPWFDYLMVSRDEMRDILKGTGWKVEKFFASEGSMYTAVIQKERD